MILLFSILFTFVRSAATICLCADIPGCILREPNTCATENSFDPDDLSKTDDMYSAISKLIDREIVVNILINRKNYFEIYYKPQLKISYFLGKQINLQTSNNFEPYQLNFTFTKYDNMSTTTMRTPYNVFFIHDSEADKTAHDQIDAVFNESLVSSVYKAVFKIDPPIRRASISFSGSNIRFSSYVGFNDFEIKSKEITIQLSVKNYIFNFTNGVLHYYQEGNEPIQIKYPKGCSLELIDSDYSFPIITLYCSGYNDFSNFPDIKFGDGIGTIIFKGTFPCPENLEEVPINLRQIGKKYLYNLKITFDLDGPQKFPFGFIGNGIYIHVNDDIELVSHVENTGQKFGLESFVNEKRINVKIHELTTSTLIISGTPLFDVVVDQYNFDASCENFPVETNINQLGISRVTIKSMTTDSPESITSMLSVNGNISIGTSAARLHEIFDDFGPFLILPEDVEWAKSDNLELYYTYTILNRVGFQNGDSWIDFKKTPDSTDNTIKFSFIWTKDPFEIPVKLYVYGAPGRVSEFGPKVDLKDLIAKYPDTIIFELSMVLLDNREFSFYSTIDLPLKDYQFTIKYVDNDDWRAQFKVNFANITKSKIKLMNYDRIKFLENSVNIFGEKVKLHDCLYSKPAGITFDTEDLEIDTASLKDLPYPLKNSEGRETIKTYSVNIGEINAKKLTIHGNSSITSGEGAVIPFDTIHKVNILAGTDLTIDCEPKLESIDNFYGFDLYITKPYSYMVTNLYIGNFPFITTLVSPINIFHNLNSTLYITHSFQTQKDIFTVSGNGKYFINGDFGEQGIYCVCESNNCNKYLSSTCTAANSVKYDDLSNYIKENIKLNKVQFLVFNMDENIQANCPIINVSVLQNRHIIFQLGILDDQAKASGLKQIHNYVVTLNNDEKMENPTASKLQLEEHCSNLKLTSSSTDSTLFLGDLLTDSLNIAFDGFTKVDLNISRLTISPTHIQSFKSIIIREELILNPFVSDTNENANIIANMNANENVEKEWIGEIYFEEKQTSTNPRLTFNYGVFSKNIKLSDNLLIVDKNLKFHIPHQESISVVFLLSDLKTNIELLADTTDVLLVPKINISGGSSGNFAINFVGNNWQKRKSSISEIGYIEKDVIVLNNKKTMELTLSDVIPLSIDYQGETINVYANNYKVGMNSIHFHEISEEQNKYQLILNSKMAEEDKNVTIIFNGKFKVDKHQTIVDYGDSTVEISHSVASIQTVIKGFSLYDGNGQEMVASISNQKTTYDKPIALKLFVKMTHLLINCLTIENNYYPTYFSGVSFETKLNKDHIKSLPNRYDDFHIIKYGSMPIVKAPKEILNTYDISSLKFNNIAIREYQALGFLTDDNIFAFRHNERTEVYEIYTTMNIYEKPMIYQIIDDNSRKYTDAVSFIKGPDFSTKIQNEFPTGKIKKIIVYISINVLNEVLDLSLLDSLIQNKANFVFDSRDVNRKSISIKISSKTSNLDINNLNIVNSEEMEGRSIDVLSLANTKINPDSKFIIGNDVNKLKTTISTYISLLNNKQLDSYQNGITLHKVKIITFTKSGWELLESLGTETLILNSSINSQLLTNSLLEKNLNMFTKTIGENVISSKISLECEDSHVQLNIKEPGLMTEVKPISITYIDPIDITLSKGWNYVRNANELKIHIKQSSTEGKEINVFSSSYPILNLFDSDDNWNLKFDDMSSDFSIELYDNYKVNRKIVFDLTTLIDSKKQVLAGKTVIFESYKSSVDFVSGKGYLEAVNIKISNNSRSSISSGTFSKTLEIIEDSQLNIDLFIKDDKKEKIEEEKEIKEESLNIGNFDMYWNYANFPSITLANKDIVPSLDENVNISIIYNGELKIDNKVYNSVLKNLKKDLFVGNFECNKWKKNVKFVSPKEIPEFSLNSTSSPKGIFELSCNEKVNGIQSLSIAVVKELPTGGGSDDDDSDDGGKDGRIPVGGIVGICLAVFVVAAVGTGVVVYFCTRNKYERLMVSTSFESKELNENTTGATNNEDED